jgi:hypothetical protein
MFMKDTSNNYNIMIASDTFVFFDEKYISFFPRLPKVLSHA